MVELDVISNLTCLSNHHARSMVDKEVLPDSCTGMNIDTGFLMSPFCHHSRKEGHIQFEEFVGDTINGDRHDARVAEHDFIGCMACRVAIKSGFHVFGEHEADLRDPFEQFDCHGLTLGFKIDLIDAVRVLRVDSLFMPERTSDFGR